MSNFPVKKKKVFYPVPLQESLGSVATGDKWLKILGRTSVPVLNLVPGKQLWLSQSTSAILKTLTSRKYWAYAWLCVFSMICFVSPRGMTPRNSILLCFGLIVTMIVAGTLLWIRRFDSVFAPVNALYWIYMFNSRNNNQLPISTVTSAQAYSFPLAKYYFHKISFCLNNYVFFLEHMWKNYLK